MSQERHPSSYKRDGRPQKLNKTQRGTRGHNGGSKFDGQHARVSRIKRLLRIREEEDRE